MMVDVSGFSRMMGRREDETVDLIQDFHRRVGEAVERFEGRVVDTAGDSVFGEFDSVVNAVSCARQIQDDQAQRNRGKPQEERLDTRIGVHLGDVIVEDYHVYGDGVNIAARLEPMADPGGICISEAVYQQIRNKINVPVRDLGLQALKNIQYPIRVFKFGPPAEEDAAPSPAGTDRERGQQAPPESGQREQRTGGLGETASAVGSKVGSASGVGAVAEPVPAVTQSWSAGILQANSLILLTIGGFLMLSPILLFPTGGALPTGGAILVSIVLGRIWAERARNRGRLLVALGIGIATGAVWTDWSRVTNSGFLLAGLIVAAVGLGRRRHRRRGGSDDLPPLG
jgi:class 3 adenylate cyclase